MMPKFGKNTGCTRLLSAQISPDMRTVIVPMLFSALGLTSHPPPSTNYRLFSGGAVKKRIRRHQKERNVSQRIIAFFGCRIFANVIQKQSTVHHPFPKESRITDELSAANCHHGKIWQN